MLGPEPFNQEEARRELPPGVATGLAWTETGGDVLYIEGTLLPDGKGLTLDRPARRSDAGVGQSGPELHLVACGAISTSIRSSSRIRGVHVHVPAGAIPKDGPSAGVTMATALTSLYTNLPARSDVAMTGEITLTGLVLPIGGIKEKVLAARRAGIHNVILPKANVKDLRDLPEQVRQEMQFHPAERIQDVLRIAIPATGRAHGRSQAASHRSRSVIDELSFSSGADRFSSLSAFLFLCQTVNVRVWSALLIAAFMQPAFSAELGSLCVLPVALDPERLGDPALYCSTDKVSFKIDDQLIPSPIKKSVKIDGLDPTARHGVVVYCTGKPQQSFRFRFSQFKSNQLFLFLEPVYRTAQLSEARGKCN